MSDDHHLFVIPGSNLASVSSQPRKVARQFELHFSAVDTHYLTSEGPPRPPSPEEPQVQDDPEARKALDECSQDLEALVKELEEFEQTMDCS